MRPSAGTIVILRANGADCKTLGFGEYRRRYLSINHDNSPVAPVCDGIVDAGNMNSCQQGPRQSDFVDYRYTDVRDMALKRVFIKKYPYQM